MSLKFTVMMPTREALAKRNQPSPFEVKKALLALELGDIDEKVLDYLRFLTTQIPILSFSALHVLPKLDLFYSSNEKTPHTLTSHFQLNNEVVIRMEEEINERLGGLQSMESSIGIREGDPLEELLKEAAQSEADLAVIGQRGGVNHHGILAKNLVKKLECNALVIPENAKNEIKKILVPVDFSRNSAKALHTAIAISKCLAEPAEVVVLNVYEIPNMSVYRIQKTTEAFKKMMKSDHEEALEAFLWEHAPDEEVTPVAVEKDRPGVARYLMDYIKKEKADFVVIGAKGHSQVERLLLGSVTERFLNLNESVPTLVVK